MTPIALLTETKVDWSVYSCAGEIQDSLVAHIEAYGVGNGAYPVTVHAGPRNDPWCVEIRLKGLRRMSPRAVGRLRAQGYSGAWIDRVCACAGDSLLILVEVVAVTSGRCS